MSSQQRNPKSNDTVEGKEEATEAKKNNEMMMMIIIIITIALYLRKI
jgi:hypothetical protein